MRPFRKDEATGLTYGGHAEQSCLGALAESVAQYAASSGQLFGLHFLLVRIEIGKLVTYSGTSGMSWANSEHVILSHSGGG